jgi:peptidylprolyl isomerase
VPRRSLIAPSVLAAALLAASCHAGTPSASATSSAPRRTASPVPASPTVQPAVRIPEGSPPPSLQVTDLREGHGPPAKFGDQLVVQYVAVLWSTRTQFDSSWARGQPFPFVLGQGEVIPGWDEGLNGMKAGGRRELIIPPNLAYGSAGYPPVIGPDETLVFVIDLISINGRS